MHRFPLSSLPNLITLGRLILVPIIISTIANGHWGLTFLLFVLAGLSDAADGFLAKRLDLRSKLGAHLDPLADKALLISIYVALALAHVIPATLTIFVVARDVMIVGAVMIAWGLDNPIEIKPLAISKLNTVLQIAFAASVLAGKAFDLSFGLWFDVALTLVAALTLASAIAYLKQWLDHVAD